VEGTKSGVVLGSCFFELDVIADDADDVRLLLDCVCEIAGVGHGSVVGRRSSASSVLRMAEGLESGRVLHANCELEMGCIKYSGGELLWRSCGKGRLALDEGGKGAGLRRVFECNAVCTIYR